jgi:hypothetical protein
MSMESAGWGWSEHSPKSAERVTLLSHVRLLRKIAADVLEDGNHLSPELEVLLDDYRDEPLDSARRDRLWSDPIQMARDLS